MTGHCHQYPCITLPSALTNSMLGARTFDNTRKHVLNEVLAPTAEGVSD